jgi:hypothetical protein
LTLFITGAGDDVLGDASQSLRISSIPALGPLETDCVNDGGWTDEPEDTCIATYMMRKKAETPTMMRIHPFEKIHVNVRQVAVKHMETSFIKSFPTGVYPKMNTTTRTDANHIMIVSPFTSTSTRSSP